MPADIITNAVVSSAGSLALLLNPVGHGPATDAMLNPPAAEAPAEHLFGDWGGVRSRWSEHGFDFTVQYFGEVAGNVSGGVRRGTVFNGLLNVAGDVDLEKSAGWNGGTFHAAMLIPHGRSLTDNYVNDLFVTSNLDASDNVHLFELWLEQNFADGNFSVRAGQMAVDQEFAFTDQGALFCNSTFGWFPIVGATAPVYPQGAPGVRIKWQPCERSFFQVAVVDGDVNPSNANGNETNPHGTTFKLDEGAFIVAEAGYNWNLNEKAGSLKLGGWFHTDQHDDVRIDDGGLSLADPLSSGTPRSHAGNWGLYVTGEQIVWKENPDEKGPVQGLGIFGRFGYALPDRNTLDFYAEGGITDTGLISGRDEDRVGLGVAFGKISGDARDFGADLNNFNSTHDPLPDHEIAIELEYQWKLCKGCLVQPGLQYIFHPGGSAATDNALVLSVRTIFDF